MATDIASRGIDVKAIELVVNYNLPEDAGDYVHRIGRRTGRVEMIGKAISFAMPDQGNKVREIERLTRMIIPVSKLPENLPETISQPDKQTKKNYAPMDQEKKQRTRFYK